MPLGELARLPTTSNAAVPGARAARGFAVAAAASADSNGDAAGKPGQKRLTEIAGTPLIPSVTSPSTSTATSWRISLAVRRYRRRVR